VALKRRLLRELPIAALTAAVGLGALLILDALLHAGHGSMHVGGPLREVVRSWTRDYRGAWIVVGLLAAALSYPVRAVFALRRRDDAGSTVATELRILAALGAASGVVFASSAIARVDFRRAPFPSDALLLAMFSAVRLEREMGMWSSLGAGLVLLAALWAFVGITWARRQSRHSEGPRAVITGLAAACGVTGMSLLRWWYELWSRFDHAEWMPLEQRYALVVGAGDPLVQGRLALIFVAMVMAVVMLLLARRSPGTPTTKRELLASTGLFVLGLTAFGLTRGVAHDARHPLPLWQPDGMTTLGETMVAALPREQRCSLGLGDAPLLAFAGGAWMVDGVQSPTATKVGAILAEKKQLWMQVSPGKSFPGLLHAAIPADVPMSLAGPFLEAARAAGYPRIYVLAGRPPRTFATRTLGVVAYGPRLCFVAVEPADAIPTTGTWGDWASSLAPR
jgi:hypothetical protein